MAAVKTIVCAESGAGKTGALASLAEAGYSLRMLDLDNNAGILRNYLIKPNSPYVKRRPDIAKNLTSVVSLSEPRVNRGGSMVIEKAVVWSRVSSKKSYDHEIHIRNISNGPPRRRTLYR